MRNGNDLFERKKTRSPLQAVRGAKNSIHQLGVALKRGKIQKGRFYLFYVHPGFGFKIVKK
jgi:hypothetical protein